MTSRARDYSRGKVYQLKCLTTGKVYIGSTTKQYLSQRLTSHLTDFRRHKAGKDPRYVTSFCILENDNFEICLLESYPCMSCDELRARERYWIENTECVNKYIPTRTAHEYRQDTKEQISARMKQYNEDNKERLSQYKKKWYESNKDKILERRKLTKENDTQTMN